MEDQKIMNDKPATSTEATSTENRQLESAAMWHARLHSGDTTEADWIAFTQWLESDEENRLAYDRVEDLDAELADLRQPIAAELEKTPSAQTDTVIEAGWRWSLPRKWTVRNWAATAAGIAAILLAVISVENFTGDSSFAREYATGVGEARLVALEDGTRVHINTDSRIVVTLDGDERRTRLEYGEALFEVARDEHRPFIVSVGDRSVRVVGTVFNILRHEGTVTVTVAEGIVEVSPDEPPAADSRAETLDRLTVGQQLVHREGTVEDNVHAIDASIVTAWKSGHLAYEDAALGSIVSDLNRYFSVKVRLESEETAALTFSGALKTSDQAAALALLEELLPIVAEQKNDIIVLRAEK